MLGAFIKTKTCFLFFALGMLLLPGCKILDKKTSAQGKPVESKYFKTLIVGYGMDFRVRCIYFALNVEVSPELKRPAFAVTEFENPMNPKVPLITDTVIKEGDKQIIIKSMPFVGAREGEAYRIRTKIYEDSSLSKLLDTHTQYMRFQLRQE